MLLEPPSGLASSRTATMFGPLHFTLRKSLGRLRDHNWLISLLAGNALLARACQLVMTSNVNCHCSDKCVGLLGNVSPGRTEALNVTVVACESVDSALSANESELGISVSSELFQMLSDVDGSFDEVVEVLGEFGGHASFFQDS